MVRANRFLAAGCLVALMTSTAVIAQVAPAPRAEANLPAQASIQSSEDPNGSGDIVVTAQKRDERLLDVPVAVTAVTAETLMSQNLLELRDYYNRIPGLQYNGDRVSQISLRGITTGGQASPTVGILVDDVPFGSSTYLGQATIPDFDPATLDRIEVLRGPQGTLYGASSLGGLLKYTTRTPDPSRLSGRVEIGANSVEDGGQGFSARGAINLPVLRDNAALSVSGFYRETPPYIDTLIGGLRRTEVNERRDWGGRAALFVQPLDVLRITLSALKQRRDSVGDETVNVTSADGLRPVNTANGAFIGYHTTALSPANGRIDYELYSARGELDLGFATLTSVSGWSKSDVVSVRDTTNIFGFLFSFYPTATLAELSNGSALRKFSQEVRLGGDVGPIEWLLGGFYTNERANVLQTITLRTAAGGAIANPYAGTNPSTYEEKAAFADLTWHATDRIDLQVGGRYSRNRQVYSSVGTVDPGATAIFGPSTMETTSSRDDAFTWLVTPSFKIKPDMLLFGRVATGYRPGGPNPVVPSVPRTFGSDRVTNYELGLKGKLAGNLLTYDLSLFQIDWQDIQLNSVDVATQFNFFLNGAKARSRGVEAALGIKPWRRFSIDANGTYTDATLRQALPASTAAFTNLIGARGDRLPTVAKFTGNLSAQQDFELGGDVSAYLGANATYVGKRLSDFLTVPNGARFELDDYTTVDLRMGVRIEGWQLAAYIRNVFDSDGVLTGTNRNGTQRYPAIIQLQPRTVGFTVSGEF